METVGLVAVVSVVAVIAWPSSAPSTSAAAAASTPAAAIAAAPAPVASPAPAVPAIALEIPKAGGSVAAAPVAQAPSIDALAGVPESVEVELVDGSATALAKATALYDGQKLKEAIALLDEVTQADPHAAAAWLLLGVAKYDRGDASGAERAAMKTLALEPKNGRALVLLASVYLDQGQEQKAKVELKRYLELYPSGPFATEARELLGQ